MNCLIKIQTISTLTILMIIYLWGFKQKEQYNDLTSQAHTDYLQMHMQHCDVLLPAKDRISLATPFQPPMKICNSTI